MYRMYIPLEWDPILVIKSNAQVRWAFRSLMRAHISHHDHRPRPELVGVEALETEYGKKLSVDVKGPTAGLDGMRLAIIKLGSTTHGNEMSRRYVWLDVADHKPASGGGKDVYRVTAKSPDNAATAPPGDYMLLMPPVPAALTWATAVLRLLGLRVSVLLGGRVKGPAVLPSWRTVPRIRRTVTGRGGRPRRI
ncbi:galactose oxidase-like domain-containing protein [Streptomyces lydicus]|uniref:galactose oxidase-like domain-containing protein n=1 Tax=Streptomyces lydicus TaxID=47763 RepID=UPI003792A9EC